MRTHGSNVEKEKEKSRLGQPRNHASSQLFDGSMLEVKGSASSNMPESSAPAHSSSKLGPQRGPANSQVKQNHPRASGNQSHGSHDPHHHPMTPPRVSGVSLAPKAFEAELNPHPYPSSSSHHPPEGPTLPSLSLPTHGSHQNEPAPSGGGGNTQRGGRRESNEADFTHPTNARGGALRGHGQAQSKRPPAIHISAKLPSVIREGQVAGEGEGQQGIAGTSNTGGGQEGTGPLQLMAEGRAMGGGAKGGVVVAGPQGGRNAQVPGPSHQLAPPLRLNPPLSPNLDPNLAHYREINGDDSSSMCGTPPAINLEVLAREFDRDHPLGPLSPNPLSPSILTICRGMSLGATRPPKGQKGIYDSIDAEEDGFIERGESPSIEKTLSRALAPEDSCGDVDGDGGMSAWAKQYQEIQKLPDMRLNLVSPELGDLEKCESPANLPR